MITIKIYGTKTPAFQLAKAKLKEVLDSAHVPYHIEEITKVADIMHDHVASVPALKVNDDLLFEIKPNGHYNASLRMAIQGILKLKNYGKMTKIIVPTDFSEVSLNAYNFAHHLAKDFSGVILLTHIYYPTSTDANQFVAINEEAEMVHHEKLNDLVASLNQDWIGSFVEQPMVEGLFKVGFPGMELVELSKEKDTILVMGTTGAGATFKKIFGSLSLDMLEKSHSPLFLVPPNAGYSALKRITYLSEDLKNDTLHLLYAGRLCEKTNAEFRLIHFRTKENDVYDVRDTIQILQNYFPELKYHIEIIDTIDLFASVKDLVSRDPDDLIVLSTKHRNIFQNLFHKSLSEFAALNSISPILILSDKVS